jgi:hypothetical protein
MNRMNLAIKEVTKLHITEKVIEAIGDRGRSNRIEDSMETEKTDVVEVAEVAEVIEVIEAIEVAEVAEAAEATEVIEAIEVAEVVKETSSPEMNISNQETLQKTQTSIFGTKTIRSSTVEFSSKRLLAKEDMTSR